MKKKGTWIVILSLIVLAAVIAVFAIINKPEDVAPGSLLVKAGGAERLLTMDEVKGLDAVEIYKDLPSGNHESDKGTFRGAAIREILAYCGVEAAEKISVKASDGYVSAFDADEIFESDNILLAYSQDGKDLGTAETGGTGPFRMIVTADEFATRCTKNIVELTAE